jgi:nickel-dependent lactate racemase
LFSGVDVMILEFGYGEGIQKVEVPDENVIDILKPNKVEYDRIDEEEVKRALENPIGSKRLKDIVKPNEKIVVITSDITRPMPTYKVMPLLLDELYDAGVNAKDITLVFALGSHRKHTREEMIKLAGERAANEIKMIDSDMSDCVRMGVTKRGTPVDIFMPVAEADRRICLGNIEYHYFAGYSGGSKAIMPGVSTREAIRKNHSLMVEEGSHAGNLDTNPVREDIEEAASLCPIDFILNVVLDEKKTIIKAVSGHPVLAHREGAKFLDTLYLKEIKERADIVLVSQGGKPKDINLYQTQKALDNAKHAVKKGGTVILIGECTEGLGEKVFEEWMTKSKSPDEMIERIRKDFQLGGHKAAAISLVLRDADIYLVSAMDEAFVKSMFLKPFKSAQEAFDTAFKKHGANAKVIAMPYGGSTLPKEIN